MVVSEDVSMVKVICNMPLQYGRRKVIGTYVEYLDPFNMLESSNMLFVTS